MHTTTRRIVSFLNKPAVSPGRELGATDQLKDPPITCNVFVDDEQLLQLVCSVRGDAPAFTAAKLGKGDIAKASRSPDFRPASTLVGRLISSELIGNPFSTHARANALRIRPPLSKRYSDEAARLLT